MLVIQSCLPEQAIVPRRRGCSNGNGRVPARPTKGAKKQRAKPPVSLFLPREMRLPSLVVTTDATAAAFLAREGVGDSAGLAQEVGCFAVARLTQALGRYTRWPFN
jgi:hypothetical protein